MTFYDLAGWQANVLAAAQVLYARDGQIIDPNDIVKSDELRFWQPFESIPAT